jgi:tetratricopeptide (TPR) repeat protein
MTAREFRAALRTKAASFLLGAAVVAGTGISLTVPAEAAVRSVVGKPLQEAQSMAASGNYSGAMAKVRQAEGASGLTPEENRVISQMRSYIESKQGGSGPKAKFSNDYRSGHWSAVLSDADEMRGQLDQTDMAAVATAYYKLGRNAECVKYIKGHFGSGAGEVVLQIERACAFGAGDDATQTEILTELVGRTNKTEYWGQLLSAAEHAKALKDHQTLDIYRIRLITGTMTGPNDYTLLAKLAIEFGFNSEAQAVIQKGIDAKLLTDPSTPRLMGMASSQASADVASFPKQLAAAKAAPSGDALIKLGEELIGQGKANDAVGLIQQGMAKPNTDMANAQTRLGQAYLAAGQKDQAARAFNKVKGTPNEELVAKLWSLASKK